LPRGKELSFRKLKKIIIKSVCLSLKASSNISTREALYESFDESQAHQVWWVSQNVSTTDASVIPVVECGCLKRDFVFDVVFISVAGGLSLPLWFLLWTFSVNITFFKFLLLSDD
jgi:hypothetical protein